MIKALLIILISFQVAKASEIDSIKLFPQLGKLLEISEYIQDKNRKNELSDEIKLSHNELAGQVNGLIDSIEVNIDKSKVEKSEIKEIDHQIKNINAGADKLKKMIKPSHFQTYSFQTAFEIIIIALPTVLEAIKMVQDSKDASKKDFKEKLEGYKWHRIE